MSLDYDPISRLSVLTHNLSGTTAEQTLTFGYNPASQIITRTESNDAYARNPADGLTRNYSVNGPNQYTASEARTLTTRIATSPRMTQNGMRGLRPGR